MTTAKQKYRSITGDSSLVLPATAPACCWRTTTSPRPSRTTQSMIRLLFRSLFGCGVICGLDVKAEVSCNGTRVDATIGRGVALDCMGNPIEVTKSTQIAYNCVCDPVPEWLWVVLCYRESCCRPKDVSCTADDDGQIVQTRVKEGYEVRLYSTSRSARARVKSPPRARRNGRAPAATTRMTMRTSRRRPPLRRRRLSLLQSRRKPSSARWTGPQYDETSPSGQPRQPRLPEVCDCYEDHLEGKCDCDCCCPCVLIGKIHTTVTPDGDDVDPKSTDPQPLAVDRSGVRWIRRCSSATTSASST